MLENDNLALSEQLKELIERFFDRDGLTLRTWAKYFLNTALMKRDIPITPLYAASRTGVAYAVESILSISKDDLDVECGDF